MIKNNFRILKKPHAYLQTILKAPVKFQKDPTETVGGVKGTRDLLKFRNHAPCTTHHGKPKTVTLCFFSKRQGQKEENISIIQLKKCLIWSYENIALSKRQRLFLHIILVGIRSHSQKYFSKALHISLKLWSLNMAYMLIFLLKKCEYLLHLQKLLTFFSAKIPVN